MGGRLRALIVNGTPGHILLTVHVVERTAWKPEHNDMGMAPPLEPNFEVLCLRGHATAVPEMSLESPDTVPSPC